MRINSGLLKFIYRGILTGMPMLTYNPVNKNSLHIPMTVNPYSTYLNFKLDDKQTDYLNNYIKDYSDDLEIVPIQITPYEEKSNYLSVNIYNCSSPVFLNDNKNITRCEINTYVKDKDNNIGTLIIDYLSNELSMDPVNIFKKKDDISFDRHFIYNIINCVSKDENIELLINYTLFRESNFDISSSLIEYTDNIYYKNGIYDKIYYDTSLVKPNLRTPRYTYNFSFNYKDLSFDRFDSIFYFANHINFVGSMWSNLYKH